MGCTFYFIFLEFMMEDLLQLNTVYTTSDLYAVNLTSLSDLENSTSSSWVTTGITFSPYYQHSVAVAIMFALAYMFIFLLCMVGNGLVCLIVVKNRHMRTVTNIFILNLAISDLLVGIFCIPTTLVDNLITGEAHGQPHHR